MTRSRPRSASRSTSRFLLVAALALSAVAVPLGVVGGAAPSASAMAIDCSYDPGLSAFIGAGRDGVTCLGSSGGGGGGAEPGPGSGSGRTTARGGCSPDTTSIPEGFFDAINSSVAESSGDYEEAFYDPTNVRWTHYQRVGWHQPVSGGIVVRSQIDLFTSVDRYIMTYNLFLGGHLQQAVFDSATACEGFSWQLDPEGQTEPGELLGPNLVGPSLAAPGAVTADQEGPVTARGALTPVPGKTDTYFLRVDLTNDGSAQAVPASAEFAFGYAYDLSSIAAVTSGTECDVMAETFERCTVPELAPGQTATLTFVVTTKAGVAAEAALPLRVLSIEKQKRFFDVSAAPRYQWASIANPFTVSRPVPVTAPKAATTPECRYAGSVAPSVATSGSPTATGGGRGTETVIAGVETPLSSFCRNTNDLPMSVTAEHGTVSIEGHGAISYTAAAGYVGRDTLSVVSGNPETGIVSPPASFEVNVVAAPAAADDRYAVTGADGATFTAASVLDNDEAPLTEGWMIQQSTTPPAHGTLVLDTRTGTFTYTPTPGFAGVDTFKYRLTGPHGSVSNVATVTLEVEPG